MHRKRTGIHGVLTHYLVTVLRLLSPAPSLAARLDYLLMDKRSVYRR